MIENHGQQLTAQLLAQNAGNPMGRIQTVQPNQIRSQGVNFAEQIMKDRAFNQDFYKQKDQQGAALVAARNAQANSMLNEEQRQGHALALQAQGDKTALARLNQSDKTAMDRLTQSDKSAMNRLEQADAKAIALEGLRNTNNLALRKAVEKFDADERKLKQDFQIAERKILSTERGDAAKLLQKQNEASYDREQKALNDRLTRELEAIEKENDRNYNRNVGRSDTEYNRGKKDDEEKREQNIKDSAPLAEILEQDYENYQNWTRGDNISYERDARDNAIWNTYRGKIVLDDEGEEIPKPTREQFLARVELSPEESAVVNKEAEYLTREKDREIRAAYDNVRKLSPNVPGGFIRNALNIRERNPNSSPTGLPSPSDLQSRGGYLAPTPVPDDGYGTDEELEETIRNLQGQ